MQWVEENNWEGKGFCFGTREDVQTSDAVSEQVGMGVREQELFVTENAKIGIAHPSHVF